MGADPLEALAAVEPARKQDKLTKALARMDDYEAQTWLDVIDGRLLDSSGNPYSANHIERAMQHAGHDVSVSSIKTRRTATRNPEQR